ncbi:MAG: DUF6266 family protein, partial [Bacteroidia bacterium]
MGTYSKSNFGKISGAVGEGVGSNWRDIKIIRSLPTKSNKPPSPDQLAVYARLALAATHLSPLKELLNIGFGDKKLRKLSGYNAAVKAFLADAITGTYPNYGVDYSKITLSKGSLEPAEMVTNLENFISLNWSPDVNNLTSFGDDNLMLVVYNETKKTYKINNNVIREEGT